MTAARANLALTLALAAALTAAACSTPILRGGAQSTPSPERVVTAAPESSTAPPPSPAAARPERASRDLSPARPALTPAPSLRAGAAITANPRPSLAVGSVPAVTGSRRAMWLRLAACEAPGRMWRYGAPGVGIDPGYPYVGAFNFLPSTWEAHGGLKYAAHAYDATPDEQIAVAEETLRVEGVSSWPICGPRVGLVKR